MAITINFDLLIEYEAWIDGELIPVPVDGKVDVPYSFPNIINQKKEERAWNFSKILEWLLAQENDTVVSQFNIMLSQFNNNFIPQINTSILGINASEYAAAQSETIAVEAKDITLSALTSVFESGGWNPTANFKNKKFKHKGFIWFGIKDAVGIEPTPTDTVNFAIVDVVMQYTTIISDHSAEWNETISGDTSGGDLTIYWDDLSYGVELFVHFADIQAPDTNKIYLRSNDYSFVYELDGNIVVDDGVNLTKKSEYIVLFFDGTYIRVRGK